MIVTLVNFRYWTDRKEYKKFCSLEVILFTHYQKRFAFRGGHLRKPGGQLELDPNEAQTIYSLKSRLRELEREERMTDTHLKWIKQVVCKVLLLK